MCVYVISGTAAEYIIDAPQRDNEQRKGKLWYVPVCEFMSKLQNHDQWFIWYRHNFFQPLLYSEL